MIGYTYCEECAAKTNEYGMFVNPLRWGETWGNTSFRTLVIGSKIEQSINDRDTIEYALNVLDKNEADDKEFFLTHEYIAGDKALSAWLDACDTDENTLKLFEMNNIYNYALCQNTVYTQKSILPYYKSLGARSNRGVNDTVIQIGIAIDRITGEGNDIRKAIKNNPENKEKNATACRQHIKNFIKYREYLRKWLQEIINNIERGK